MPNTFAFTPKEAQPTAEAIATYYQAKGCLVAFERPISPGAPYTTTILACKMPLTVLVEVQYQPEYHRTFREFVLWLRAKRAYVEIYLGMDESSRLTASTLQSLKEDGVGILFVAEDGIIEHQTALNPAHTVTVAPELRFGSYKESVFAAVNTFNRIDRKHGLQELCEVVEDATRRLLRKTIAAGWMNVEMKAAEGDWSHCINILAAADCYLGGRDPLIDEPLKNDLHSFRGARNLVDHPPKNKRQGGKVALQYVERMSMGPRLVAELVALFRRVS